MVAVLDLLDIKPDKSIRGPKRRAYYDKFFELNNVAFGLRTELFAGIVLPA
jgi:hypothetical protein